MASIIHEITVAAKPDAVWERVRDVGNAHLLFAGVLKDSHMEGLERVATFANGMVVRERILDVNERHRRVAYTVVGGRAAHHNASVQVFASDGGGARVQWITDLLPDELAPTIGGLMEAGIAAMKRQLEQSASR